MDDQQYRAAIDDMTGRLGAICAGSSVGIVVPACMEVVLNACLSIEDRDGALKATDSLRPMIDYIEGQIRGGKH